MSRTRSFPLFLAVCVTACLLTFLACSDDPPPAPPPHVTTTFIEVAENDYTSISLKLSTTEVREGGSYAVTRNGLTVWEGLLTDLDTLIADTALTASSDYRYRAYAFQNGALTDSSDLLTTRTKDTTSGDFTWEVITMGQYPSMLRDVFMISPTDVWAVGKLTYYRAENDEVIYNALHWDGIKWDTLQVPTQSANPDGTYYAWKEETLYSVYAPVPNDVWFTGEYGGVTRWLNGSWDEMKPPYENGPGRANGIWGTSNNLIFATWGWGIRGWDGSKFYSVLNHDEIGGVDAQDAWGVGDTTLVIAGDRDYVLESQMYRVVNGTAEPFPSEGMRKGMVTLWFANQNLIFAGGSAQSMYRYGQWINEPINHDLGFIHHIRGIADNDVFAVGAFATVLHYSGLMWQAYPEIDPSRDLRLLAVAYDGEHVFAVGENTAGIAVILHGKRK